MQTQGEHAYSTQKGPGIEIEFFFYVYFLHAALLGTTASKVDYFLFKEN